MFKVGSAGDSPVKSEKRELVLKKERLAEKDAGESPALRVSYIEN